jgi:hypothetical protein
MARSGPGQACRFAPGLPASDAELAYLDVKGQPICEQRPDRERFWVGRSSN